MKEWLLDFRTAVTFLTRVPLAQPDVPTPANFARAHRVFPLVGVIIGTVFGLFHVALVTLGLPVLAAAALVFGGSALFTGALHEDGLADLADGFGGGRDKSAKLDIMRDSRLGTYGTLVLLVSFVAKVAALAALPIVSVLPSLIVTHALARSILPFMAMTMPYARTDGLAATAGRPNYQTVAIALGFALVITFLALPWTDALAAVLVAAAGAAVITILALRQIGGQTGDVLGAAEQVVEVAILLLLAARLG